MADFKLYVLLVHNTGRDISAEALERRIAIAKRRHPKARILIRIVNR